MFKIGQWIGYGWVYIYFVSKNYPNLYLNRAVDSKWPVGYLRHIGHLPIIIGTGGIKTYSVFITIIIGSSDLLFSLFPHSLINTQEAWSRLRHTCGHSPLIDL